MYRVILSGVEVKPMLLVVNIFTSPIGTDCGWSAPVVGLYTQAESFLEEKKKNKTPYSWELHVQYRLDHREFSHLAHRETNRIHCPLSKLTVFIALTC